MSSGVLNDKYWVDAANSVIRLGVAPHSVIAPSEFSQLLQDVVPYERRQELARPEAVIIHKGMLEMLGREWLEHQLDTLKPAFANEVFVTLVRGYDVRGMADSVHFRTLLGLVKTTTKTPAPPPVTFSQRAAVYLGDHRALARTVYGHKIFVDTRDVSLTPHIILDGFWEQWVTDTFRGLIKPGMTVVDIGANIGYYALIAADLVGGDGKLVAFEANPAVAAMLHSTMSMNGFLGRSRIESKAVFSHSTTVPFGIFACHIGGSSIYASDPATALLNDEIKMIEVQAVSLDEYFSPDERVDVMKIDAEGAEPAILKGATRIISDNKDIQIIMEFAPSLFKAVYGTPGEFYEAIRTLGLKMHRIAHDGRLIEQTAETLINIDQHWDVLLRRW